MVGTYWRAVVPFLLVRYNEGSSKCYSDGCLRWRVAGVTAAPSCSLLKRVRGTGETWVFVRSLRDLARPLSLQSPPAASALGGLQVLVRKGVLEGVRGRERRGRGYLDALGKIHL